MSDCFNSNVKDRGSVKQPQLSPTKQSQNFLRIFFHFTSSSRNVHSAPTNKDRLDSQVIESNLAGSTIRGVYIVFVTAEKRIQDAKPTALDIIMPRIELVALSRHMSSRLNVGKVTNKYESQRTNRDCYPSN